MHFVHLKNIKLTGDASFYETEHLNGRGNIPRLIPAFLKEMKKRKEGGRPDFRLPVRPDHGIKILNDFQLKTYPGYPFPGRAKGLAEISGTEEALLNR